MFPLTALGLAHGHRRTDSELKVCPTFDRPEETDRCSRRGAGGGAISVCSPTRNKNTESGARAGVSPGEERQGCVSRCDFQCHWIESANMF
jgi:hypothetical protein